MELPAVAISTSRGSSRGSRQSMTRPSGSQVGTSFMEWTATSISPASNASSISLVNRPLPPISLNGRSCTLSPVVLMTQISMAPGAARCRMRRDQARARLLRLGEGERRAARADAQDRAAQGFIAIGLG